VEIIEKNNPSISPNHKEVSNPTINPNEYFERLKQKNPKRYERIMKLRATRERKLKELIQDE